MSPRRGRGAARRKSLLVLAAGLMTGLGISVLGQACFPGCDNVESLHFKGGDFMRTGSWGEIAPHPSGDEVRLHLNMQEHMLTVEFDTSEGRVVELWELGRIEEW